MFSDSRNGIELPKGEILIFRALFVPNQDFRGHCFIFIFLFYFLLFQPSLISASINSSGLLVLYILLILFRLLSTLGVRTCLCLIRIHILFISQRENHMYVFNYDRIVKRRTTIKFTQSSMT